MAQINLGCVDDADTIKAVAEKHGLNVQIFELDKPVGLIGVKFTGPHEAIVKMMRAEGYVTCPHDEWLLDCMAP